MENKRSEFKKLLEATVIPEVMPYEEREPLLKPLLEYVHSIIPQKLFRYRDCSETQFDAFYNDRIYAGNAQKFNDPYDCLIRYDKQYLYDSIKQGASKKYIRKLRDSLREGEAFPEFVASLYGEERTKILKETILNATDEDIEKNDLIFGMSKDEFFYQIENVFREAESYLRRSTFIACFSETVKSVTMWSHYANSHKGFVLEYDLRNRQIKCDNCENKFTCKDRIVHNLYPIIYDYKRYDGTYFVDCFLGRHMGLFSKLSDVMFINKAALYKSPQWAYEKEWRLFLDKQNSYGLPYLCTEIRPVAIYYGKDISAINKKILSNIAKEKGLKEYQMYIDVQSEKYTMKYKKHEDS